MTHCAVCMLRCALFTPRTGHSAQCTQDTDCTVAAYCILYTLYRVYSMQYAATVQSVSCVHCAECPVRGVKSAHRNMQTAQCVMCKLLPHQLGPNMCTLHERLCMLLVHCALCASTLGAEVGANSESAPVLSHSLTSSSERSSFGSR